MVETPISKSEYMKAWRAKKELEDPGYADREREKAKARALAKWEANKYNPEYLERERERKRLQMAQKRATAEGKEKERLSRSKSYANPDNREKHLQRTREWKAANADKVAAHLKQWRDENAEHVKQYQKAYSTEYRAKEEVKTASWQRNLWKNYKMTDTEFNELWNLQSGKCAICDVDMNPRGRARNSVSVDHHHITGAVRGLLCSACNRGIGILQDSPDILKSAAKYLEERGSYSSNTIKGDKNE
jgi:hypothetical protein